MALGLALGLSAGCSCGDNHTDGGGAADGGVPDAPLAIDASVDAATCDTPTPGAVGGACSDTPACTAAGGNEFCLNDNFNWVAEGFCTIFCTDSADCGEGSSCSMLPDTVNGGSFGACMPDCCDEVGVGQACEAGRICSDGLFGDPIMTESCVPGTADAPDGVACTSFADCARNGFCRNDQYQFPGGHCATLKCTGNADCAPGGDGRCVDLPDQVAPLCVDDCDVDADCREAEGYKCIDRGGTAGKFCQHPGPRDPCTSDLDCGLAGQGWTCREGGAYPGGYCTVEDCLTSADCPIFSFCVSMLTEADQFCADQCQSPGGNECGTGYKCVEIILGPGMNQERNVCVPEADVTDFPSVSL